MKWISVLILIFPTFLFGSDLTIPEGLRIFSIELLEGFPERIEPVRRIITGLTLPIFLLIGLQYQVEKNDDKQYKSMFTIVCAIAFITMFVPLSNALLNAGEELGKAINGEDITYTMASDAYNMIWFFEQSSDFQEDQIELDEDAKTTETSFSGKLKNKINSIKASFSSVSELPNMMFQNIRKFTGHILWILFSAIIQFCLYASSYIIVLMDTIRYFLIQAGSVFAPMMIAGLTTGFFNQQSKNYLFIYCSLFLWPIGWGLGHVMTAGVVEIVHQNTYKTLIETAVEVNVLWLGDGNIENTIRNCMNRVIDDSVAIVLDSVGLIPIWKMIQITIPFIGLCLFIFMVALGAPSAMTYLVWTGMSSAMMNPSQGLTKTLSSTASVGGGAASGGAPGAIAGFTSSIASEAGFSGGGGMGGGAAGDSSKAAALAQLGGDGASSGFGESTQPSQETGGMSASSHAAAQMQKPNNQNS